jgi:hypothetical protein
MKGAQARTLVQKLSWCGKLLGEGRVQGRIEAPQNLDFLGAAIPPSKNLDPSLRLGMTRCTAAAAAKARRREFSV